MNYWVRSAFLFYSPPTFSNPISKIEINQNFFLCKSYSKTSKKILNSWTWTGTKTKDLQGSKAFLGRLNLGKQYKLRFQGGQVWGDKKMYMSPHRKISSLFWGKRSTSLEVRKKNSPQCCLIFLDNPFFVFQNFYPCYRCILNELQKLYGFYGRQGSEAKCTILAYFFLKIFPIYVLSYVALANVGKPLFNFRW